MNGNFHITSLEIPAIKESNTTTTQKKITMKNKIETIEL